VLALALGLGTWLRLRGLAELPLHGDEYHTLLSADQGYGAILTSFDSVGSHVPLPLLQHLSLDLFGPGVMAFRLVAIVPGLLLLVLAPRLLRPWFGADAAALATLALALDPMVVYYARFARAYELGLLLALVLGWGVLRVLESSARGRAPWLALVASAALLPWVHLSTLGFVAALGGAAIALALWNGRASTDPGARRGRALRVTAAFALAGVLAFLLYLPVLGQVVTYFRVMESEPPPSSWLGVPTLLAGGRVAAWTWMLAIVAGAVVSWRSQRAAVLLAGAALAGPLALLLATDPRGLDYAWARYVLSALPFLMALAASVPAALVRVRPGLAPLAMPCAALLLGVWFACGPLGLRAPRDGSFSNTYLALHDLPAFDEPDPATPAFYRELAADPSVQRIVEAPPIYTRAVLLYRNYALQHGKPAWIGWPGEMPRGIQGGPYARLLELTAEQADYVVLHRDPAREVHDYFRFVYEEAWPRNRDAADESFMLRQEAVYGQNLLDAEQTAPLAARLLASFGPASYKDERILVWKLPAARD